MRCGVWKETASGATQEPAERKKVLALAQAPKVDVILVTELTSWGRSVLSRHRLCLPSKAEPIESLP